MWANSKLLCGCLLSILSYCHRASDLLPLFWIISYCFWGPRTPHCKTLSSSATHPLDLLSSNLLHQTYEDCFLFTGLCESPAVKVFYMVATFSAPKVFSLSKTQKIGCAFLCALALLQVAHTHERTYLSQSCIHSQLLLPVPFSWWGNWTREVVQAAFRAWGELEPRGSRSSALVHCLIPAAVLIDLICTIAPWGRQMEQAGLLSLDLQMDNMSPPVQ